MVAPNALPDEPDIEKCSDGPAAFSLTSSVDAANAQETCEALRSWLSEASGGTALTIELTAPDHLIAYQLAMSASKTAEKLGLELVITGPDGAAWAPCVPAADLEEPKT